MNILVFYIDVGNKTDLESESFIEEIKNNIDLSDEEKREGNVLKTIFIPVKQEGYGTRIEVIALEGKNK